MNFKKFDVSDNQWHDVPYYQHKTATDTLTLPAVIYPNDTSITVGIKGQSSQASTPTPSQPCDVNGTGERTGNLFDGVLHEGFYNDSGQLVIDESGAYHSDLIRADEVTYTISGLWSGNPYFAVYEWDVNRQWLRRSNRQIPNGAPITFTLSNNCVYFSLQINSNYNYSNIMLNLGSTPLPYEPYGYKIPILNNSQTTNVYLGEVQSARKVKKLVLTGEETGWNVATSTTESGTYVFSIRYDVIGMGDIIDYDKNMLQIPYPQFYSTHFKLKSNTSADNNYRDISNGEIGANSVISGAWNYNRYIIFATNQCETVNDFIQLLAAQYAAGTPVCVWYVLATPETGIVNEPLMRIGDYADSLTTSIPCTAGENTLDVQTTVQPSEVTATFEGWHPVQSVHERENGQWD